MTGTGAATRVRVVGCSVRGASHVRANQPNQDAYGWRPESGDADHLVVAVADGHGSDKSFRSRIGAELAVAIANRVMTSRLPDLASARPGDVQGHLRDAAAAIVDRWTREVRQHLAGNRFTDDELDGLDDRERREVTADPLYAYGSTLLCLAVTRSGVHYLQLGDGDIVFVARDGTTWEPLGPDARMMGNETSSLCMPGAKRDFRVGSDPPAGAPTLACVSTDGFANSYTVESAFHQFASDLLPMVDRQGIAAVGDSLEEWLQETTEHGSGDDVTLVVVRPTWPAGMGRPTAPTPRPAAVRSSPVRVPAARRQPSAAAGAGVRHPAGIGAGPTRRMAGAAPPPRGGVGRPSWTLAAGALAIGLMTAACGLAAVLAVVKTGSDGEKKDKASPSATVPAVDNQPPQTVDTEPNFRYRGNCWDTECALDEQGAFWWLGEDRRFHRIGNVGDGWTTFEFDGRTLTVRNGEQSKKVDNPRKEAGGGSD